MESDDALDPCQAKLAHLVARAETGEAEAIAALRKFLVANPAIWTQAADLASQLVRIFVDRISCGDALQRESLMLKVKQLQAEHAGPNPTALERLIVERIIVAWLALEQISGLAAQVDGLQQQVGWYIVARQHRANKQFLNAIEMLATVRKLPPNAIGK